MPSSSNSRLKSQIAAVSAIRRVCRSRTLCSLGVTFLITGVSCPARAQERGAIGGALSTGVGLVDGRGAFTANASAWYRLMPALAMGLDFGSTGIAGFEQHDTEVTSYSSFEGFVDARGFPASPVGVFGRVSAGVAHVTLLPPSTGPLYDEEKTEPILELEAGPELRVFFAPPTARARPDLFFRVRGTLTTMSGATLYGLGLSLGFEG